MKLLEITPFDIAHRYIGLQEIPGEKAHPFIQWCFSLCGLGLETPDEVPWCSAFMQHPAWELHLPRTKSARARSWLFIGKPVSLEQAEPGFDVVVLQRGKAPQPGADVLNAPGHVGFFAGVEGGFVRLLGGNQSNTVSIVAFPATRVLGVRRLI